MRTLYSTVNKVENVTVCWFSNDRYNSVVNLKGLLKAWNASEVSIKVKPSTSSIYEKHKYLSFTTFKWSLLHFHSNAIFCYKRLRLLPSYSVDSALCLFGHTWNRSCYINGWCLLHYFDIKHNNYPVLLKYRYCLLRLCGYLSLFELFLV